MVLKDFISKLTNSSRGNNKKRVLLSDGKTVLDIEEIISDRKTVILKLSTKQATTEKEIEL